MTNDLIINNKSVNFPLIMKRMQFVEDIGYFTRKFTRIYVEDNQLYIGHTINKKRTKIEFEDLDSWIQYFDRI